MATMGEETNVSNAPQPAISGITNMLEELHARTVTLQQAAMELGEKLTSVLYAEVPDTVGNTPKKQECPMMEAIQLTLDETNETIGYVRSLIDRMAL